MSKGNLVLWAKGALEKGDPLNIIDDQFRAPTLAEDLADACILSFKKEKLGVYNASGKDIMSIYEIVERLQNIIIILLKLQKQMRIEN